MPMIFAACFLRRYDFFQTLCEFPTLIGMTCELLIFPPFPLSAIVGGLLTLVNMGPGGLSVDEQKKIY